MEGRPRYASAGNTTCDETCAKLLQTTLTLQRGGEFKEVPQGIVQLELLPAPTV